MFDASPYEPVKSEEVEATLAEAISSAGEQMTRYMHVLLAGICAKHLTEQLALAGFVFMRLAAANASARGQRIAILASPLHELTGFYLAVDCLAPCCKGERTFAIAELANFYGRQSTVGEVLRRTRCSGDCGGRVEAAWLVTGPILNPRVRPRRVALRGPEARNSCAFYYTRRSGVRFSTG
jgi:hypothetical protein